MARRTIDAAFLAVFFLAGCSAKPPAIVPAEGVVLLNGAPLPRAKVSFFPQFENASEHIAFAMTDENGRFALTCHGKPGACATMNIVTVADEIPEHLTPERAREKLQEYLRGLKNRPIPDNYRSAANSPVRITVSAEQKDYKIELSR